MSNSFGLPSEDLQRISSVFARLPEIHRVVIYGSRAKATFRPSSDIDLTIMDEVDWASFNRLESQLDDLLLPYQIDLSIFSQIDNPDVIEHIQRVGKDFFVKETGRQGIPENRHSGDA